MPWTPLKDRLDKLPLILCGPILRRTEPESITVWVALRDPRIVTLRIYSETDSSNLTLRAIGTRDTAGLGQHLHIVAVTAQLSESDKKLVSGEIYYYNLFFDEISIGLNVVAEGGLNLQSAGIVNAHGTPDDKQTKLYYSTPQEQLLPPTFIELLQLPTFSLPPNDLNSLRILHGSCRKLHNDGLDAMPGIDDILVSDWANSDKRPHMLFLTGDQIYADDIADTVLFLLDDASDTLMGWREVLPDIDEDKEQDRQSLRPGNRKKMIRKRGGFTTEDTPKDSRNHLLRLGEFYAAYLFYWSDVLWPQNSDIPEFEQVHPGEPPRKPFRHDDGTLPSRAEYEAYNKYLEHKKTVKKERPQLLELKEGLHKVRRALANIPTYMIFDDHDITDDWNMTRDWCERTLLKPLGYRVIQNALLAYAVFQAWGNTPAQFAANEDSKGEALLAAAYNWSAASGQNKEEEQKISERVGLPPQGEKIFMNDIDGEKILIRPSKALTWHYSIKKWPKFEVIVLDTRTRHSYPGSKKKSPSSLLSASAFKDQIDDDQQNPETLVTFVVVPTPLLTFPFFRTVAFWLVSSFLRWRYYYNIDSPDHWQNQEKPFELLIAKLASRTSASNNERRSRIVILTGDVHFSTSSRLQYWAVKPYTENTTAPSLPTQAVFAQFSASSFKKQDKNTKRLHFHGYEFGDLDFLIRKSLSIIPVFSAITELINREPESTYGFGSKKISQGSGKPEPVMYVTGNLAWLWDAWKFANDAGNNLIPKSDWVYRIDFVIAENELREPVPAAPTELLPPDFVEDRVEALKQYVVMSKNHEDYARKWGHGKEIIGVNNFCEISFDWAADQKTVIQKSWWRLKSKSDKEEFLKVFPLSKFCVSLEFDDSRYKKPMLPGGSITP
ncbi:MAG: hypothetical protein GY801_38735 [bacterium]|nr:hypothetical protein [bacterium]